VRSKIVSKILLIYQARESNRQGECDDESLQKGRWARVQAFCRRGPGASRSLAGGTMNKRGRGSEAAVQANVFATGR